jgi:PIN domain nuclease of toxin-antitoxin system
MIYLDTHVVVWLYAGDISRLSRNARTAVSEHELRISPIVFLELTYLREIGRVTTDARTMTNFLNETVGLEICNLSFEQVVLSAVAQEWTRDPFDRLIVGHAASQQCALLTKDEMIRENYPLAIW